MTLVYCLFWEMPSNSRIAVNMKIIKKQFLVLQTTSDGYIVDSNGNQAVTSIRSGWAEFHQVSSCLDSLKIQVRYSLVRSGFRDVTIV